MSERRPASSRTAPRIGSVISSLRLDGWRPVPDRSTVPLLGSLRPLLAEFAVPANLAVLIPTQRPIVAAH